MDDGVDVRYGSGQPGAAVQVAGNKPRSAPTAQGPDVMALCGADRAEALEPAVVMLLERLDPAERERIMTAFAAAATRGDLAALESVLTEDVVSISDGGGVVSAARMPVVGRARVARFVLGALAKFAAGSHPVMVQVNGSPAVLTVRDGEPDTLLAFEVGPDGISRLLFVRNPHKLTQLRSPILT